MFELDSTCQINFGKYIKTLTPAITGSIIWTQYSLLRSKKCLTSGPVSKLDLSNLENWFSLENVMLLSDNAALNEDKQDKP